MTLMDTMLQQGQCK